MIETADKIGYRYERKFRVEGLPPEIVEAVVKNNPAMFAEIYHRRFVNNIYFDSASMNNYFDAVNGDRDRVKTRIRWYGDLFGKIEKPVLELKIKNGLLGVKRSYELAPFEMKKGLAASGLRKMFQNSDLPPLVIEQLLHLEPVLLNRYSRKYFRTASGSYRITVDRNQSFFAIRARNNQFLHSTTDPAVILELKYGSDNEKDSVRIASHFPFRLTKNSKFVNGLELLNQW
ncbi:MAG: VTC domain-containing protein [Planctomycetota bacterium]|jgi:SPX domain protein involved in polyphosphate accumulation